MNSEKSTKSMVGEVLLDIVTMGLLLAAFGTMFYNGFIVQSEGFTVDIMAAITFIGLIILFCIGTLSCLVTKVKKHSLTVGFLTFSAIQLFALVCNWAVLICLLVNLFTVENSTMRISYAVTTAVLIIGYIASILSYSNGIVDEKNYDDEFYGEDLIFDEDVESEDDEDEDEDENEDEDDEEEEEEEEYKNESEENSEEDSLTDE